MRAEEYLTILTDQIRCRMAREDVRKELLCHIEDQKAAFLSEGMEAAEAEEAAVREMGDPVETGNELDRIHRPKMAWGMIALIAVLSIVGYLAQYLLQEKWIAAGGTGLLCRLHPDCCACQGNPHPHVSFLCCRSDILRHGGERIRELDRAPAGGHIHTVLRAVTDCPALRCGLVPV